MKGARNGSLIRSYEEFLASIEVDSDEALLSLIDGQLEPDFISAEITSWLPEDGALAITLFFWAADDAQILLEYPFRVSDWEDQLTWLDDYEWFHRQAREACIDEVSIGDVGAEDDVTGLVSDWLNESEGALAEVLGQRWTRAKLEAPEQDVAGKAIQGWFVPDDGVPALALGLGGNAIYVEAVTRMPSGGGPDTLRVEEEWPVPQWTGPYYDGTYRATRTHRPRDPLPALRRALTEVAVSSIRPPKGLGGKNRKGRSVDHDVRLSTKNLRIEGIDLDFEVKVDGSVLGTLSVSEGGLLWRPANRQKRYGINIPWKKFAQLAEG